MQTSPDCYPCLLRQILATARLCGVSLRQEQRIMQKAAAILASADPSLPPPLHAVSLYRLTAREAGCPDPYRSAKEQSNRAAMALLPQLRQRLAADPEPLRSAVRYAAAGNLIDYGSQYGFELDKLDRLCEEQRFAIDDFTELKTALERAERVLYLADNCGEIAFDRLLIEELAGRNKELWVAFKEEPVINDALVEDGRYCGLDRFATLVSNGTACPGTPLANCSAQFQELFQRADCIISKGQGNFETLSETPGPLFFLLTVKCQVVARHLVELGRQHSRPLAPPQLGDRVLLRHPLRPAG